MRSFTSLSVLFSLALASVSASPVEERAGTILCSAAPDYTRPISINVRFPGPTLVEKYFGLAKGSNVLVSSAADGTNFTKNSVTKFDFYDCKSTFLGTQNDGNYGILKPHGDSQNCVRTKTGSVTAKDQVMVVAPCSYAEDQTQEQQTFEFSNGYLTLTSTALKKGAEQHPTFFRLGNDTQGSLHLLAGYPRPPAFQPSDSGDYDGLSYLA